MNNCIFCKIIKGEIPSYKIYENEHTYAFLDISKDCYGHTLVIPKKHSENILDTDPTVLCEVSKTIQLICHHYESLGFEGFNILNNNNSCAEQSIHHLHFHILPRKENDGLKIFPNLNEQNLDLEEIQKKLFKKNWHQFIDISQFIC